MKKIIFILIALCGILLISNFPVNDDLASTHSYSENKISQKLTTQNKTALRSDAQTAIPFPTSDLIILAIMGLIFAKKHQSLAKKHRNLTKNLQNEINSDSVFNL